MGIGREISGPVAVHGWMVSDRRVMKLIASALSDRLESV
jgi:hypothetical protein